MSFYASNPFNTGSPQELTLPGVRNPMLPQPVPGKDAAGPRMLAGLGAAGRIYAQQLRSQKPAGLQGLGSDPFSELLQPGVNAATEAMWAQLQPRMDAWMYPVKVGMWIGLGLTVISATFSALNYYAPRRR